MMGPKSRHRTQPPKPTPRAFFIREVYGPATSHQPPATSQKAAPTTLLLTAYCLLRPNTDLADRYPFTLNDFAYDGGGGGSGFTERGEELVASIRGHGQEQATTGLGIREDDPMNFVDALETGVLLGSSQIPARPARYDTALSQFLYSGQEGHPSVFDRCSNPGGCHELTKMTKQAEARHIRRRPGTDGKGRF